MMRFTFADGRWLELGFPTVGDQIAIVDFDFAKARAIDRVRFYMGILAKRVAATSWAGPLDELTATELTLVIREWLSAAQEVAVPKMSGSSSDTPPLDQRSPARTERRRRPPAGRGS